MRVAPGSWFSVTTCPRPRSRSISMRICVVFPAPSVPSKLKKDALVIDEVQQRLQIFPGFALGLLIVLPQQVGRMIGNHHWNISPFMPFAARPRDAFFRIQQRLHGSRAEHANGFGSNRLELPEQELPADFHFIRLRRAILRRPALHYVADVHVRAVDGNAFLGRGIFNHLRQELPGPAHEWQALVVFVRSRSFAYEHQRSFFVPGAEYDMGARFAQTAALAIADIETNLIERIVVWGEPR